MEKLVYCLWRAEDDPREEFCARLRTTLAEELHGLGARGLRVYVADPAVDAGTKLRLTSLDAHKEGFVTFWLECSQDRSPLEQRVAAAAGRIAGHLVVESRPMIAEGPPAAGQRSPGWVQVTGIAPKEGLSYDRFLRHWYDVHRAVAIETQSSTGYVRNEIVRPLTENAPGWSAIVEETFPLGALDDPGLVRAFARTVRDDYRAMGIRMALHPQVDLATEPRWARQAQSFGADPHITARLMRAYLEGLQGLDLDGDAERSALA